MPPSEFADSLGFSVLHGQDPTQAIEKLIHDPTISSEIRLPPNKGLQSRVKETVSTIMEFGQSCHGAEASPCVIHLVVKYTDDLREALIQNTMAGGNSAGRNMIVGMILGAHLGMEAIPKPWLTGLAATLEIDSFLDSIW